MNSLEQNNERPLLGAKPQPRHHHSARRVSASLFSMKHKLQASNQEETPAFTIRIEHRAVQTTRQYVSSGKNSLSLTFTCTICHVPPSTVRNICSECAAYGQIRNELQFGPQ